MDTEPLKCISLFADMDEEVLAQFAKVITEQAFGDGQRIFSEGEAGETICFVGDGMVRVEKKVESQDEEFRTLSILGRGEFFGEMALFDRRPRSASTTAYGGATIFFLSKEALQELLANHPAIANRFLLAVIQTFSQRIRSLNADVIVYHEIGRAIGGAKKLQELLDVVLKQVRIATEAESGMILVKQEFAEQFELKCSEAVSLSPQQMEQIGQGRGIWGQVMNDRRGVVIHDWAKDDRVASMQRVGFEQASMIIVPFHVREELLGMMSLGRDRVGGFSLNDFNLCEGVASQTAQSILEFRRREEDVQRQRLDRQFVKF